jgi:DNA (cytosine-5)-methyltransferase 1
MPRPTKTVFRLKPDDDDGVEIITERPKAERNNWSRSSSTCTLGRDDDDDSRVLEALPAFEDLTALEDFTPSEDLTASEDLTVVEDLTGEENITVDEVVDLTIDDSISHQTLRPGEYALASWRVGDDIIRPDECVEVKGIKLGPRSIHFVIVKAIARARSGKVTARGIPLIRTRGLDGKLQKKRNEVCRILHIETGDDSETPLLVDVTTKSLVKKRTLVITNARYPEYSCVDIKSLTSKERAQAQEAHGTLVCRWSLKVISVTQGNKAKPVEEALERIPASEVRELQYRKDDEVLSQEWRGGRIPGGSWSATDKAQSPIIDLESDKSRSKLQARPCYRKDGQKYTLFDSFSGAGGVSRGAQMAGFKVTRAVDKAAEVWPTYKANFPDTRLFKGSVDEFIQQHKRHIRADVLHLSPPCQYFSPAHTHSGANDAENIAALFSGNALIKQIRPRLITVEQTFGIMHERHRDYLNTFISDFTQHEYSIRWKIERLCTWGSAQDRKRLIMIAAAPGESLPPFPRATHAEGGAGGLKPYVTIRHALSSIRRSDALHNLDDVRRHHPRKPPYNPDRLSGTLTTGGSGMWYPDGSREFTLRELACLQGFPRRHIFKGSKTSIKMQIGNAFPSTTVRVLYKHLEKWLLHQDGMLPCQQPLDSDVVMLDIPADVIIVDDSDASSVQRNSSSERHSDSPGMTEFVEIYDAMEIEDGEGRRRCTYDSCDQAMIDLT